MTGDSWNDRDIDLFHAYYKAKQETVHFGTPELQESAVPVQLGVPYRLKASNESWSRKLPGSNGTNELLKIGIAAFLNILTFFA